MSGDQPLTFQPLLFFPTTTSTDHFVEDPMNLPVVAPTVTRPTTSLFTAVEEILGQCPLIRESLATVPGTNKLFARPPVEPNRTDSTQKKTSLLSSSEEGDPRWEIVRRFTNEARERLIQNGVDPLQARYVTWNLSSLAVTDLQNAFGEENVQDYNSLSAERQDQIKEFWNSNVRDFEEEYRRNPGAFTVYPDDFLDQLTREGWSDEALEKTFGRSE
jgi:hypothetical protein